MPERREGGSFPQEAKKMPLGRRQNCFFRAIYLSPELWCQGHTGDHNWGMPPKEVGRQMGSSITSTSVPRSWAGTVSAMDDMHRETGHAAEARTKEVSWHSFGTNFLIRVKRNLLVAEAWLPDLTALSSQPPFCLGLKHRPDRLQPI